MYQIDVPQTHEALQAVVQHPMMAEQFDKYRSRYSAYIKLELRLGEVPHVTR